MGKYIQICFNFFLLLLIINIISCKSSPEDRDYREDMRDFVISISGYAKAEDPDFIIIPQNGEALIVTSLEPDVIFHEAYLNAIDGQGREDLFYGYDSDNTAASEYDIEEMLAVLDPAGAEGLPVLVTDYCWTESFVDDSIEKNQTHGFIPFPADSRNLNTIPDYPEDPGDVNSNNIASLNEIKNFLYIINPDQYETKEAFLSEISGADYDLLLIDLFFNDEILSSDDVSRLKTKAGGRTRLVICYMSIGEAEDYRYYWESSWSGNPPSWLGRENPDWEGNYKVCYWDTEWQAYIFGSEEAYLDKILAAGFDGVYLDLIDAYEYYEY